MADTAQSQPGSQSGSQAQTENTLSDQTEGATSSLGTETARVEVSESVTVDSSVESQTVQTTVVPISVSWTQPTITTNFNTGTISSTTHDVHIQDLTS